jgi:hypothetical protein
MLQCFRVQLYDPSNKLMYNTLFGLNMTLVSDFSDTEDTFFTKSLLSM